MQQGSRILYIALILELYIQISMSSPWTGTGKSSLACTKFRAQPYMYRQSPIQVYTARRTQPSFGRPVDYLIFQNCIQSQCPGCIKLRAVRTGRMHAYMHYDPSCLTSSGLLSEARVLSRLPRYDSRLLSKLWLARLLWLLGKQDYAR